MHKFILGLIILSSFQSLVIAEDAITHESAWSGEGELGFHQTTGNTENQNLISSLSIGYKVDLWEHDAKLEILRSEDNSELVAESYGLKLKSNYDVFEKGYLFGRFRYEDVRFSGYNYQSSLIFGYGHKVMNTDRMGLYLETGIGIGKSELENSTEADNQALGFIGLKFRHKIGEHSAFTQEFKVEGGSENIYTESDTGFKVSVTDTVALKLSLVIKSNSEVPADSEKTDTISAATFIYSF